VENLYKKTYCIIRNKQEFNITPGHPLFCCQSWIDNYINDMRVPISYNPWRRCYYIIGLKETIWIQVLTHCLLCLTQFSENLTEERDEILKNEYGIIGYTRQFNPKHPVPKEFFTEEWWRKRGL
jgi:hypothetical protein